MNTTELALQLLPRRCLEQRCRERLSSAEELRLRVGQPLSMLLCGREYSMGGEPITADELLRTLEKATGASIHTVTPTLQGGFISYHGLRIGVCGTLISCEGERKSFRHFSSLAVRIPRECRGSCDGVFHRLRQGEGGNVLILSPPGGGKSTALRELVRLFSEAGERVGLVDERMEIAAAEDGVPQFSLGPHCDVLSGVPKAAGAMMLLRAMNPQILAMDEITRPEDLDAVREIVGCGVKLIATAHAASYEDLGRRPLYRRLLEERVFSDFVIIESDGRQRSYTLRREAA